jgi:DNA-binding GntR family transcriptional regulator
MSLDIPLSGPHEQMLEALRAEHGDAIDEHLRQRVEAEIHESYQQLRGDESG